MKNSVIALRINEQEKALLEQAARVRDISVSQLLREAARKYLIDAELAAPNNSASQISSLF